MIRGPRNWKGYTMTSTMKRGAKTFTNAIDRVDSTTDLRAAVELTESLIRDLERRKRDLRAQAIEGGLAKYDVTQREGVPAKGPFIEMFGRDTFDKVKTVSDVKRFVWID